MQLLFCVAGIAVFPVLAWFCSSHRARISYRTTGIAFALQFLLGAIALYIPVGRTLLEKLSQGVSSVLGYAQAGIEFIFGEIGSYTLGTVFAVHVLPVVVFFASLVSVLYYLGVMGWVIRLIGGGLQYLLGTSKAESMSAAANIFVGHTEAPLVVKPYLADMSRSELFSVMVIGLSTVAGSVLAGYVALGVELRYLLAASFMAAPGGFLMAKLLEPETTDIKAKEARSHIEPESYVNVVDAAAAGATDGLKLALNIGAMLLAFVALIAMLNGMLGWLGSLLGFEHLTLQFLLGWLFRPVAVLLGIPWEESLQAGSLIGQKLVFNEFVAYAAYSQVQAALSEYSRTVVTFALCGFANIASVAVLLGGVGTMVPSRRNEIAALGMRAVLGGFLANLLSAAIAGFFLVLSAM
jgi:concentrative nucleoside transporter, CNT family